MKLVHLHLLPSESNIKGISIKYLVGGKQSEAICSPVCCVKGVYQREG